MSKYDNRPIIRCVRSIDYNATIAELEEELINDPNSSVLVWYMTNYYNNSFDYLMWLKAQVLNDFPNLADKDIIVQTLSPNQTIRHEGMLSIRIYVPNAKFIEWREKDMINIL